MNTDDDYYNKNPVLSVVKIFAVVALLKSWMISSRYVDRMETYMSGAIFALNEYIHFT